MEEAAATTQRRTDAWIARLRRIVDRVAAAPGSARWALGAVLSWSLVTRMISLGQPCSSGCSSHTLIFDEAFYVNAARVIDHIHPPAGAPYATAPLGVDPNAEHPQLAKLIIALGIKAFGDGPWGWRIGSIVFGTIALIAIFLLIRSLTHSEWQAVAVTAVMSMDNLFLVHGRIATLDIYALAVMLLATGAYVERRPLLAGVLVGVAACLKETALVVLLVFVLDDLFGSGRGFLRTLPRLVTTWVVGLASSVAVLAICDAIVTPYDPGSGKRIGSVFGEIHHIFVFGKAITSVSHATGISSSPWQWLVDQSQIPYARVAVNSIANGKIVASHVIIAFEGAVNPFIMFVAIPALIVAAWGAYQGDRADKFAVAWFLGTFLPYVYLADVGHRTSYLYYVLDALPAIYLAAVRLFRRAGTVASIGWAVALLVGVIELYPIRTF